MSSEYTIHLEDDPITEIFNQLGTGFQMVTIKLRLGEARLLLFVKDKKRSELAEVLRKVAQKLAPSGCTAHLVGIQHCPCWQEGHQAGYEAERRPIGA